jgi:hypothetical protein
MAEDDKVASAPQESLDGDDAKPVQSSAAKDETAKS